MRILRALLTGLVVAALATIGSAIANYSATTSGSTTFGSILIGGTVHYAQQFICDYVTPSQCVNVSSGGAMKVDGSGVTQPVSGTVTANLGTISTAATAAAQTTLNATIGTANSPTSTMMTVQSVGGEYPTGAVTSQDSDTGTTASTASSLPAVSSYTQYVCGISIRANATAAATGNATLSDGTWTLNFTQWTAPLASGLGEIKYEFSPCKPASAANTAITLTSAAPGSGGVVSTGIWGYRVP